MLRIEKEANDDRGTLLFLSKGDAKIHIAEIKKGYSRGGHYHDFESSHNIISGKIEYKEKDVDSGSENVKIIAAPANILTPKRHAHLLTAIEDTVFAEVFYQPYSATNYPEYRKVVESKLST